MEGHILIVSCTCRLIIFVLLGIFLVCAIFEGAASNCTVHARVELQKREGLDSPRCPGKGKQSVCLLCGFLGEVSRDLERPRRGLGEASRPNPFP